MTTTARMEIESSGRASHCSFGVKIIYTLVANNRVPCVPSNPTKISCFIGLYDSAVIVLLWVSLITASLSIAIFNRYLDSSHLWSFYVVIACYFVGEITVQDANEQSMEEYSSSMLPRQHEKDWVEFEGQHRVQAGAPISQHVGVTSG